MVQVLKDEVRKRIFEAALNEFYKKDFKNANLRDIADEAEVSVGLIYSYFDNKEGLFEAVVKPVTEISFNHLNDNDYSSPYEAFTEFERDIIVELLDNHREFVILADKSFGTKYENYKEDLIGILTEHIAMKREKFSFNNKLETDDVFMHILASTFVEGILEIARHHNGKLWAENMLDLFSEFYYTGIR